MNRRKLEIQSEYIAPDNLILNKYLNKGSYNNEDFKKNLFKSSDIFKKVEAKIDSSEVIIRDNHIDNQEALDKISLLNVFYFY